MKQSNMILLLTSAMVLFILGGCATESSKSLPIQKVETAGKPFTGTRTAISIGKFDNRSSYMRGIFSDGEDRLGKDRTGSKLELGGFLIEDRHAGDVGRQQVRRALQALE